MSAGATRLVPDFTRAKTDVLQAGMFAADAGASDTYTATLSPAITAYVTGAHYRFKANTANTGAATINFNSLGAKTIVKATGGITTALADNDIRAGQWVDLVYDGTNMQMQSTLGGVRAVADGGTGVTSIPKFSATRDTDQVITTFGTGGFQKVEFANEDFDIGAYYDNATNFRYTPLVAGKYLFAATILWAAGTATAASHFTLYKNGTALKRFDMRAIPASSTMQNGTALVDMNGSTDYVEVFVTQDSGVNRSITGSAAVNRFTGFLVP